MLYMSVRIRLVNLYLRAPMFYIPILSMEAIWFIFVMIQYSFFWMFFLQKVFLILYLMPTVLIYFICWCPHIQYTLLALPNKKLQKIFTILKLKGWPIVLFNSCYYKHYTIPVPRIRTGIRFIRIRVDREIWNGFGSNIYLYVVRN